MDSTATTGAGFSFRVFSAALSTTSFFIPLADSSFATVVDVVTDFAEASFAVDRMPSVFLLSTVTTDDAFSVGTALETESSTLAFEVMAGEPSVFSTAVFAGTNTTSLLILPPASSFTIGAVAVDAGLLLSTVSPTFLPADSIFLTSASYSESDVTNFFSSTDLLVSAFINSFIDSVAGF